MNTPAGGVTLPELLPCPFCGSAPGLYHRTKHNRGTTTVCCDNVECMTQKLGFGRTKAEREANAIAAWNTRAALAGEWRDVATLDGPSREVLCYCVYDDEPDQYMLLHVFEVPYFKQVTHYREIPAAPLPKEPGR